MENVTIDVGQVGLVPRGEWDATVYYYELSLVVRNGQGYVALRPTTGDDPETCPLDWMLITQRGESLYQMMVRTGRFVGTEDEFLNQYQKILNDCIDATESSIEQQREVETKMSEYSDTMDVYDKKFEGYEQTIKEIELSEIARNKAENSRSIAEGERTEAEQKRIEGEQHRDDAMRQISSDADNALRMAAKAQQDAEEAFESSINVIETIKSISFQVGNDGYLYVNINND